jgi:lipopolysaccharide transport system ATP-binding protein
MSDTVIKVENISKRYRLGLKEKKADTFAQQMVNVLKYPIDNFRRIQNLRKFDLQEEEGVHWALKDISFEVNQGEVLGIIGKNGAGKSTLLKILSKITEPTSGRIEVNGRIAALLEVGTGFHPELSGRENIYMNGTILGMTKREIDKKLDEIIDFSGVEKFIDTPIKFYSSGMKVRLGFSVAAHLEPEILVIDEVLSVGDFEFQKKCLGKMEDVAKNQGRTVLFVSHNMTAVKNLCNRSIVLKNGLFVESGDTKAIINKYINGAISTSKERVWDHFDFKGQSINPLRLKIESKEDVLTVEDNFNIIFEIENAVENERLNISLVLNTEDEVTVLNSISTPTIMPKGKLSYACALPKNFLNSGIYTIRILVVKDSAIPLLDINDALTFEVHETTRDMNWYGKWIGVVRPKLEWTILN